MRDVLRRYQPDRIEDLTALNALYRPGPIQGGMIDDFIERKHGRAKIEYELPELKPILEGNLRRHRLPGTGDADREQIAGLLARRSRPAASRHGQEESAKRWPSSASASCEARCERGYPPKKVEKIFDLMEQFAGYGFNKSHSAAYALLAYSHGVSQDALPVEFMAALLTSVTGNTDDVVKYINECREMGIEVLPPDIN